jgi:L-threonylcarbamoyladenylate synthase
MARILFPTDGALDEAAAVLRQGGRVAFPTETVYGLGANALDEKAVAKIFAVKGRPAANPLIVHIASPEEAERYAEMDEARTRETFALLTQRFWPGPLTLVLTKRQIIPEGVTAGGSTVGLRMPNHPLALALLRAAGLPLAAPSANRSEQVSPTRAVHVVESLGESVDIILDGGQAEVGLESTVLDITAWPPRLLRPGLITPAQMEEVLKTTLSYGPAEEGTQRSPGQMKRHYAPQTPLRLTMDAWAEAAGIPDAAVLALTPPALPLTMPFRAAAILPSDAPRYGAALYEALRRLDTLRSSVILAENVPETEEWLAVRDRLSRAAAR